MLTGDKALTIRALAGFITASCVLLACDSAFASASNAAPSVLRVGDVLNTSSKASDRAIYRFDVSAGAKYLLEVKQHGLDFVISIRAPGAKHVRRFNSPLRRDGSEYVLLEAPSSGEYRFEVYSEENTGARGMHSVSVTALSSAVDSRLIDAWRAMTLGAETNMRSGKSGWSSAISAYEEAAGLWTQLSNAVMQAHASL
ncbi:MAG: hypothetical protein ACN4GT_04250, partial [Gammaproteobacteria bacterium]